MYTAVTQYAETGVCISYAMSSATLHASKLAKHFHIVDHQSGPESLEKVNQFKTQLDASRDFQNDYRTGFRELQKPGVRMEKEALFDSTSVFHNDFFRQAGSALHKNGSYLRPPGAHPLYSWAVHASLAKIQAIGVARSLGSNVRGAVAEAPGLTALAKRMFPSLETDQ